MPRTPPSPRTRRGATAPVPSSPAAAPAGDGNKKTARSTVEAEPQGGAGAKPGGSAGPNAPTPAELKAKWGVPEDWMGVWIEAAIKTGKVSEACRSTGVTLVDVDKARRDVPAFREACVTFDVVADILIQDAVRSLAMDCNPIGLRFYFQCMRPAIFAEPTRPGPQPEAEPEEISPEEAGLLIRRALEASGDMVDGDEEL